MNAMRRSWRLINKQDVTCAPAESAGTKLCFMNVPYKINRSGAGRGGVRKAGGWAGGREGGEEVVVVGWGVRLLRPYPTGSRSCTGGQA